MLLDNKLHNNLCMLLCSIRPLINKNLFNRMCTEGFNNCSLDCYIFSLHMPTVTYG